MARQSFRTARLRWAGLFLFLAGVLSVSPVWAQTLTVGSKAPAIDVEHWIQNGNGRYKPVAKFEKGKIYVIEFWATWCAPCVMEMPNIARLQQKHRQDGVQIVSITNETVDEVKQILGLKHPLEKETTIAEITSLYCLTADPDRSVEKSFKDAAGLEAIPIAFIVGKTGLVEWIGHPGKLETPLELIVNKKWKWQEFKKVWDQQQLDQKISGQVDRLLAEKKFKEAIEVIDRRVESLKDGDAAQRDAWAMAGASLRLSSGLANDQTYAYYQKKLEAMKDQPAELIRFALSLEPVFREGGKLGPLPAAAAKQLIKVKSKTTKEFMVAYQHALALMNEFDGNMKEAIQFQKLAVEAAEGPQKERLQAILERFEEEAKKRK